MNEKQKHDARDAMKLPVTNTTIPGTLPRDCFSLHCGGRMITGIIGTAAALAFIATTYVSRSYHEQAHEIHHLYTTREALRHRADNEMPARLSVHEELQVLHSQGTQPKSWAVEWYKKMGYDYLITPEGRFEKYP